MHSKNLVLFQIRQKIDKVKEKVKMGSLFNNPMRWAMYRYVYISFKLRIMNYIVSAERVVIF